MNTVLVGHSGVGKGPAIRPAERMLHKLDTTKSLLESMEGIRVGADSMTPAGLMDEFLDEKTLKKFTYDGETFYYNHCVIVAEELSTFYHNLDNLMLGRLIKLLDCEQVSERLRKTGEPVIVENTCLHIIGGVQPKILLSLLPANAFDMGVTTRTQFVYSTETFKVDPFGGSRTTNIQLERDILHDLKQIMRMVGPFDFMREAQDFISDWWLNRSELDRPRHPRLEHYQQKRIFVIIKNAMAYSASRSDERIIRLEDVERAHALMLEMEATLPEMFSALVGEFSTENVFAEVAHEVLSQYELTQKPVPHHLVTRMIAKKVKAYEIINVLESMVAQQYLEQTETSLRIPGKDPAKAYLPGPTLRKTQ